MEAVEFFKTVNRYCKNQGCKKYLACRGDLCMIWPDDDSVKSIEETISKVEQWAKDHPVKTRQSEFLKMFPHANINSFTDTFCVAHFDKTKTCKASAPTDEMCEKCRDAYWNEEVFE